MLLRKTLADAVDMLRPCLKHGEDQLSPEQTMLQRKAEERDRREVQRQSTMANTSPLSSRQFTRQQSSHDRLSRSVRQVVVALENRAGEFRPRRQETQMVFFRSIGGDIHVRSFVESLDEGHTSNESSKKVGVKANLIHADTFKISHMALRITKEQSSSGVNGKVKRKKT